MRSWTIRVFWVAVGITVGALAPVAVDYVAAAPAALPVVVQQAVVGQAPAAPVADTLNALELIRGEILQYNDYLDQGYNRISAADTGFGGMGAKWVEVHDTIDTNAAVAGEDVWDAMKREMDQLQIEFNAGKTTAAAQKAALDAL